MMLLLIGVAKRFLLDCENVTHYAAYTHISPRYQGRKVDMRKALRYVVFFLAVATGLPAFAGDISVQNAAELKSAINSSIADNTILLQNDINMSGTGGMNITGKSVTIDGQNHGITSSRNFSLIMKQKGNLTIKNVGQVDRDYNIISSFRNNYDTSSPWGGPITTQNNAGTVVYDENSKVILENSVFSNNYARTDGGVLGLQTLNFDVQNSVFINNSAGQEGGAIWAQSNWGNIENSYFKGNFVRDLQQNTSIGGAITSYGYYANRPTYIDTISGTFIENYSYNLGGAIVNRGYKSAADINKISGYFSANYAIQTGGAILNAAGSINTIDGTFIKNYLLNTSTSSSTIKSSSLLQNNSFGGAIANTVTGGNEAKNDSYIKSISGDFIGNFINTKNGKAYGGAIYNTGIIEDISGNFLDNYVFSEGTSANLALGGAIYSTKDLTITSGKSGTLFSGNYTLQNIGDRNYNAIYIDNANATLNLTPKSGKTIQFDDNIDGVAGYNVNIESEYGGTLKLYNDIKNANITTNDVNIDFVDSKYHNYEFLSLTSSETTNYAIDFKLDKNNIQSDTITTTNASSGYVTLSDIHFIADKTNGGDDYYNGTYVKQILFNNSGGTLKLQLGANLQQTQHKIISTAINDTINPITNASDKYYKNIYTGDLETEIRLHTTSSSDDSIELKINKLTWSDKVNKELLGDTFALWLDLETSADKEFRIAENQQYKINETLDTVNAGKLSVIGKSNISSVIDVNNKALFDLSKESNLTLKDVRIISAASDRGSVVKAMNPNSSIIIDNASFHNNIAALLGGVLFNASTKNENKINGIFNANMAGSSGGAIYNQGNIDSIEGEFSSNHTTNSWATGKVVGGAIANKGGTINSINANFNSNYSDQYGGAIANFVENSVASTINSINGNFNNNYIVVNNSEAFGGAIYNNGEISTINGNFIGNHIAQDNLDKVNARGGAIYNWGKNDLRISGQFLDNYISVNSSSIALGGAIYTKMNTSIVADNGQNTLFKGNYVKIGNNKNDNAIYVDNVNANLTLSATNNGVISLYDNIDGAVLTTTDAAGNETTKRYKVLITGDNTGVVGLYNDIKNADVKAGIVSINLVDGKTKNYTFNSLNTEAETSNIAKWNIDVDLTNVKADTITTTDTGSKGTVLINNLNITGSTEQDSLIIQILKNTPDNNNLQLQIADGVLKVVTDVTAIGNEVYSSKSYLKQEDGISLATTNTTNDSIKFLKDGFYDALQLINQKETTAERKFTFDTAGTHTLLENLGETKGGELSINGYSNDSSVSVINLAGKTGFELANGNTTINLNNATLTDSSSTNPVIAVTSENNIINLNNAQLKGNITANKEYKLNLIGSNVNIDGTVDLANATLDNAQTTLTFNTDTFANASLSSRQGTINLADSALNIYNIGTLKSDNTLYNIDVDAFNKASDTIKAGEASTGDVKIGSINFLNGITPQDKDFKVKILDTTSLLTLSLSDAITNQLYDFGHVTDTVKDTINTTVNVNDRFYESVKDFVIKGHLSVLDDNKSIGFKDEDMQKVAIAVKEQELLDSLHELSGLNASGKQFNFNTADDVYGAMTDIGTVINDLTINGVADSSNNKLSVIGLDNNSGFILNSGSSLNISNINLRGTNSVITNNGGTLNFNNKNIVNGKLDGNGTATNNGELYIGASNIGLTVDNKNKLYLSEGTLNKTITGSGETIINSGILTLGVNAKVEGTLDLNGGKMSAVDNNYNEYNINNLVSNGGRYSLDIDLTNKKADTIKAASGSGTITLDNLNITGSISNPTADYKIQILNLTNTSSSLQLALSEALSSTLSPEYVLSRTTGVNGDLMKDEILANTSWDKVYKQHQETHDVVTYGKLGLATTTTTNDSIGMNVSRDNVLENSQTTSTKLGDTLKLVNQDTTNATKNFTTTDATASYEVTEDLGTTQGTLNIVGKTDENGNKSTIDLNGKSGFVLDDSSTALNLSNVKLTDSTSSDKNVITATTRTASIDITDSIINGNIQGAGNRISFSGVSELNGNITNINTEWGNNIFNFGTLKANSLITGYVENSGDLTVSSNGSIIGDVGNIGTFYANGSITGAVRNRGTFYANSSITGDVENKYGGNLTVSSGGSINGNVTNHTNSTLTNNGAITGDVENSGTLTANGSISGNVTNSGTLTSAIDNLQGSLTNNGTYNMTGTNVTLNKEIAGTGTTVLEQSATLQFGENGKIDGILSLDNNTINMQESSGESVAYSNVSIGKLTGTGSLKIDVDLKNGYSDKLNLSGNGSDANLTITSINVRKDGIIDNVSYLTGNLNGLDLALGTNSDLVSTVTNDYTYTFSLDETKGNLKVVATELNTKPNTLKDFITGQLAIPATTYSMTKDITITAAEGGDFGTTPSENKQLNLYLNGHTLNGTLSGEKKGGIVISSGDQLDISGNVTSDKGKISGFSTAISVENGGKLKINEVKLSDNTTDINNSGNLEASDVEAVNIINAENGSATIQNSKITGLKNDGQAYLSGENEITNIASINDGKGTLNIGGNATVSEEVKQGNVLIAEGAKLTTVLSGYKVNSTQNEGILSLTGDGTISQKIFGESGHLELNGTVTNNAEISQLEVAISGDLTNNGTIKSSNKILNTGTITTDASNITATNGIENKNFLTLNGGILDTAVNGNGKTYITGTVTNNSEIAQAVDVDTTGKLTIDANIGNLSNSGKVIAKVDNLKGSVYNSGEIELSGTLNKAIEGSGTTTVNNTLTLGTNAKISGTLNLNDKSISTSDGHYTNYDINSIIGSGKATIDVDWANQRADTFQTTSGNGTLSLSLIQTSTADIYENKTINITNGMVGISLTEITGTKTKTETGTDNLKASVDWRDKFGGWTREDTYSEKISAVKSEGATVNDSIQYEVNRTIVGDTIYTDNLDTLSLIVKNSVNGSDTKTFTTNSSTETYNVTADLGTLRDNLVISGKKDANGISTINIGNHQGITILGNNSLTLKDVKVTSAGTVVNAESNYAQTTLDNAQIDGNIVNAGNLNLKGNTKATNISGTGYTVVDTSATAQISSLIQNTLSNSGNLTADSLAVSESAENNGILTNNGISSINALTNNTGATINGSGSLTLSGTSANAGTITQKNLIVSGNIGSEAQTYTLRSRAAHSGRLINRGTITAENIENSGSIDNTSGTLIGRLANSGTITRGNITAKDGTINLGSITDTNLYIEQGFSNEGKISGTINISNTGNLANIGLIDGDITNGGVFTSSLDMISGTLVNNGTFKTTGGELNSVINGTGTTEISGNVNINSGGFATGQSVRVLANSGLDIGTNRLEIDNFTLLGTLDVKVTNIQRNSSIYDGGQISVNNADLSGGKVSFTIAQGLLNKGEKTGDLSVIALKSGATGNITGDLSGIFETNNRYEIQQGSVNGSVIIKNTAAAADIAGQIGNQNNRNTASAWDKAVLATNTPSRGVQDLLNSLSQHNKEGYRNALNKVAPSDSQFKLENTRMVQNLISNEVTRHFEEDNYVCGGIFRHQSMWMSGLGGYNRQSNRFDAQGFKAYTNGYALGYDSGINCHTSLGFGYAYTKTNGKSNDKDMNISMHNIFVYGKYNPFPAYVRWSLMYGFADNREKTSLGQYGLSSNYNTHYIGAETYVGYEYLHGVYPEIGFRYTYLKPDDYTDSLGQHINNKNISALMATARLNYKKEYKVDENTLIRPEVYAGITYDMSDTDTTSLVSIAAERYAIRAYRSARFGSQGGIAIILSKGVADFMTSYDVSIKKDYEQHSAMLKFRYNF